MTRLSEDDESWLGQSVRGIEAVFSGNTYGDRLRTIALAAGFDVGSTQPTVSVVIGPESDVSSGSFSDITSIEEILVLDVLKDGLDEGIHIPIRRIEMQADGGTSAIADAARGDWIAFVTSESDVRAIRSLVIATRIAPAEIYVPAPSWAEGHVYVDGSGVAGCSLVSKEFVARTGFSPWSLADASAFGARVYSTPIVND